MLLISVHKSFLLYLIETLSEPWFLYHELFDLCNNEIALITGCTVQSAVVVRRRIINIIFMSNFQPLSAEKEKNDLLSYDTIFTIAFIKYPQGFCFRNVYMGEPIMLSWLWFSLHKGLTSGKWWYCNEDLKIRARGFIWSSVFNPIKAGAGAGRLAPPL